jgi:cell division septation protein DedD
MSDLSKLRVAELKDELQKRGASTSGVKSELLSRLEELVAKESEVDSNSTTNHSVESNSANTSPSKKATSSVSSSPSKKTSPKHSQASHFEYEFGGPIGALGVMVGLPGVIYMLFFACGYVPV